MFTSDQICKCAIIRSTPETASLPLFLEKERKRYAPLIFSLSHIHHSLLICQRIECRKPESLCTTQLKRNSSIVYIAVTELAEILFTIYVYERM